MTGPRRGWGVSSQTFLDAPAYYSNFGTGRINFAAPGGTDACFLFDYVFSTIPGGWGWVAGTSMAAPHASGIAVQYIGAAGGSLPPVAVETLLRALADHPNGNHRRDDFYVYGRVDATPVDQH